MENDEKVQLDAWQKAFGTTQLTHAFTKYEVLQDENKRLKIKISNIIKNAKNVLKKHPVMESPEDLTPERTTWEELVEAFISYYYVIDDIAKWS